MSNTRPVRILIVDDDAEIRGTLRDCFEGEGYEVFEAQDGLEMRTCLERAPVELITLDLRLGRDDGFELAREIRSKRNVPIIMITGKGDTIDRVLGLELGADDYLVKPFEVREVLARVRAVLRRYQSELSAERESLQSDAGREQYTFDGWVLDIARREVRSPAAEISPLTASEFDLLVVFAKHSNRVMTRDKLLDLVKGREWSPSDRTIDGIIARLRKAIEEDSSAPKLIKTVRSVGYVFVAEVRRL